MEGLSGLLHVGAILDGGGRGGEGAGPGSRVEGSGFRGFYNSSVKLSSSRAARLRELTGAWDPEPLIALTPPVSNSMDPDRNIRKTTEDLLESM